MTATTQLREDLIETAVKFLQNAKVRQSPFTQRKSFLLRKGLTEYEIEEAVRRSGTAEDTVTTRVTPGSTVVNMSQAPMPVVEVSMWSRVKDWMNVAVFIGGALYAIYQFYKKVLVHWLFGDKSRVKREVDQPALDSLQRSVTDVSHSVTELRDMVSRTSEQMNGFIKSNASDRGGTEMSRLSLTELKDEVKSLKSLLLNKNQFPQVPVTTPVIPAWQLQMSSKSSRAATTLTDVTKVSDVTKVLADTKMSDDSINSINEPAAVQQTTTDQDITLGTSQGAGYQTVAGTSSPVGNANTECSDGEINLSCGEVSETKVCDELVPDCEGPADSHEGPHAGPGSSHGGLESSHGGPGSSHGGLGSDCSLYVHNAIAQ